MEINKLYEYPKSMRSVINGGRHYDIDGDKLPSVTTILSACQTDEKRASLAAWKARVGPKQADEIRDKAAERGTAMHTYLEHHISGSGHKDLTVVGQHAEKMAKIIIEQGLGDLGKFGDWKLLCITRTYTQEQRILLECMMDNLRL
jgi:hypothetical protein